MKVHRFYLIAPVLIISLFSISLVRGSVQARASHILVDTENEIDELYAKIIESDNMKSEFESIAKDKSKCPSGRSGGDLGSFGRGMMVPEFDKVVFEEPVGVVHKVKTQFGWHLVLTTERTGEDNEEL